MRSTLIASLSSPTMRALGNRSVSSKCSQCAFSFCPMGREWPTQPRSKMSGPLTTERMVFIRSTFIASPWLLPCPSHPSPHCFHEQRLFPALDLFEIRASPLMECLLENISESSRFESAAERTLAVVPMMPVFRYFLIRLEKLFQKCFRCLRRIFLYNLIQIWHCNAQDSSLLQYAAALS